MPYSRGEDIKALSAKWQNVGRVERILYNFNDTHLTNEECETSLIIMIEIFRKIIVVLFFFYIQLTTI